MNVNQHGEHPPARPTRLLAPAARFRPRIRCERSDPSQKKFCTKAVFIPPPAPPTPRARAARRSSFHQLPAALRRRGMGRVLCQPVSWPCRSDAEAENGDDAVHRLVLCPHRACGETKTTVAQNQSPGIERTHRPLERNGWAKTTPARRQRSRKAIRLRREQGARGWRRAAHSCRRSGCPRSRSSPCAGPRRSSA